MAIEAPLATPEIPEEFTDAEIEIDIIMPDDELMDEFDEDDDGIVEIPHAANLAEYIPEDELDEISSRLREEFEADRRSRSDWAQAYVKGMDLLGMKIEDRNQPFEGASGVFHPVLTEAIIRFQAQAIDELFPASGPARTKLLGKITPEKQSQAKRVEEELNYQCTEEMSEYRDEMEQMLFHLPMAGSAFKKIYYNPIAERPSAPFVPAEDIVVNYGATDLQGAARITHVMKKDGDELEGLQDAGFYRDIDLAEPAPDTTDIQKKYDEISGEENPGAISDDRYTLLEIHTNLKLSDAYSDGDELARPYVVTIDKSSGIILAVRKNWDEGDVKKKKMMHFVHYKYLPGLGFYGTGLIHLLGGLTKTATSLLRQLIDAGTLANLPAGLKSRGLRIKGDNTPFQPGEFRDVDVPGQRIQDSITFLPFKEPSAVLYNLLDKVTTEARKIGSVAESDLSSMSGEMPVGTTFALLEREQKVMSSVQARMHAALKKELRLIAKVIGEYMGPQYAYDEESEYDRTEDFSSKVDVIPVSDPNASTAAPRVVSYQAALQLSAQAPQFYNQALLHRQMLETLGIENAEEIVQLPSDITAKDPITENMALLNQEAIQAFAYQDHEAHIASHMAMAQDPKILQMVNQSPFAQAIMAAGAAHITEHIALLYRKQIEEKLGVSLPSPEEALPEDVEVKISRMTAQAAQQLLAENKAEDAAKKKKAQEEDPLTQIQKEELAIKRLDVEKRHEREMLKLQQDGVSKGANFKHMEDRLESEEQRAAARLNLDMAKEQAREMESGMDKSLAMTKEIANDLRQKQFEKERDTNGARDTGGIDPKFTK